MEKIKKIHLPKNWESDFALRILAVIIAVIIWVLLSITQYPTTTIQIANVPVVFSLEGTEAKEKGLSPVDLPDNLTVNVEIKGMKYEIGGYTEKDLNATVDLNPVNNEGTYSLDIDVASNHTSDQCTIVSVTPATINVSFEKVTSKTFDVDVEAENVVADDGLVIKNTSVSPSEIEIEGTKKELNKISKVCAKVNDKTTLTQSSTISTSDLIFYDKKGKVIQSDKYTLSENKNFDVKFTVYKKRDLALKVNFSGCPDNFDTSTIPYQLSENSVQVITPVLSGMSAIEKTIGTLNLSDIDLNKTFNLEIELNKDEKIVSGEKKVKVSFDKRGFSSKSLTIPSENIEIVKEATDLKAEIQTENLDSVTLIGPAKTIESISSKDIIVQLDLSSQARAGKAKVTPLIYSPNHNDVWCYGDYTVDVQLS
ncbi:MAG: hypothetical protein IJU04_02925 [Ruminococcus sp.]|nr:hypothetical protein [Ruminococcus sp.]